MRKQKLSKELLEAVVKNRENYVNSIKDEYQLLQTKIDKYGESSLRYKQFAITVALAVGYFAIKEHNKWIALIGALYLSCFYSMKQSTILT
jgi:hypothetical protein